MDGREPDLLRVGVAVAARIGVEVGQQRHLAEERLEGLVLFRKPGHLLEVLEPRVVVRELVLQIILVPGSDDHADEVSRPLRLLVGKLPQRLGELLPAKRGLFWRVTGDFAERLGQAGRLGQARGEGAP